MELGIDVFEKYQGNINWVQVAGAGVKHALIKLTNGASVASPAGDHYVNGARGSGLRVGGYHYALGGSATAQADAFANELLRLNDLDDAPALDYEDSSLPGDAAGAKAWICAFFNRLKSRIPSLTKVILYSSGSELARINAGAITVPGLTILIWDAEYGVNDGAEHPRHYYTGPVAIHQFSSAGHIPGISGLVDVDNFTADTTPTSTTHTSTTPASSVGILFGEDYDMQPKTYGPVPVTKDANGKDVQVAYDSIQWDGRAAVANVIALDDQKPVFVAKLGNWGNKTGTAGGVPAAGTNPPSAGPNTWRVDPNLPVSLTVPEGTLRVFFSYSCNGRTGLQIVPTA
ncbi:glycoside hydrolase family 25 protein [Amycolatopsis sp. NPDC051373]|uniref:glycoside hydrolase family 25 protein n=1 Tax=Amycolatopsis sp. NPDC051373 TaxID=3155801 RepID=UPI00344D60A6